ncbi:chloride channel protein [Novosphingobium sp. FSW06-99]|uniref:chloride channel protein n=1 Tax=Novosphingobium sp. FSW06-99 TaxID=1739113 RepID=UPI00076DC39F|nr:chloride channel protein [Novosphingobium sp. FSW06-99]KUR75721.1 chloride channel protein [Novosphingobium sp. FSW06-99]
MGHAKSLTRTAVRIQRWLRQSEAVFIALAALVGATAGLTTLAQAWLAHAMQTVIYGLTITRLSALISIEHPWRLIALPLGGSVVVALGRYRGARRGGAPVDVVEANALHGGRIPTADNFLIAAQTIVSNGCGASVGLEATYAQMGGGLASWLGQRLRLRRADLRRLVGAGAGAGVGAAFGTPLAGAFYAFEIVIGSYSIAEVAPVIAASLAGVLVQRWLGSEPYLMVYTSNDPRGLGYYGAAVLLGLLCAGLGIVMMRLVTATERVMQAVTRGSAWRPVLGGALLVPIALISPQALSAGHGAMHLDLVARPAVLFLLVILALKILASVISLASGFRGGLFFASLFIGSLAGQAFAQMLNLAGWGVLFDPADFALVGMAALCVSVVGGPMTLALLTLETTHDFPLMGVVLTAALISSAVTREAFGYSFSTWRLHVRGSDIRSPRDIGWILNLTAERMMRRDFVTVPQDATIAEFRERLPLGAASKALLIDHHQAYRGIVQSAAAHAPTLDPSQPVAPLACHADSAVAPDTGIKAILALFDAEGADELAVVDADHRVLGVLGEAHVRRRYLEEIEAAQRRMFGEG